MIVIRGGHRHLQIGQMLDIDIIPDLRLKGVKCQTLGIDTCKYVECSTSIYYQTYGRRELKVELFRITEIKDCAIYLDLCTGRNF
jgi:hypothetical protein